jgi:site-specific recombinase XerD
MDKRINLLPAERQRVEHYEHLLSQHRAMAKAVTAIDTELAQLETTLQSKRADREYMAAQQQQLQAAVNSERVGVSADVNATVLAAVEEHHQYTHVPATKKGKGK